MKRLLLLPLALALAATSSAEDRPVQGGQLTQSPVAIASFGAAVSGQYLYMIGGNTGRAHEHHKGALNAGFYRLNLRDQTSWELLPGGVPMQSVALVPYKNQLIRIAGLKILNAKGEKESLLSSDEVARYDPISRAWTALPPLPEPRSSHDAMVCGDALYVFGGWRLKGDEAHWYKTGLRLDLEDPAAQWTPIEQPFHRRALAVIALESKLYAIGGITRKGKISSRVDIYDAAAKTWSRGPDLPGPGFGTAAAPRKGEVIATDWTGAVYALRPGAKEWRGCASLDMPRFFHRLLPCDDDRLIAVCGASFAGKVRSVEWLDIERVEPRVTRVELPLPIATKQAQGLFIHRGQLHLFGGNTSLDAHDFEPEFFSDQAIAIDIARLRAGPMAAAPLKRQSFQTWITGERGEEKAYALGGFFNDGKGARSARDIIQYDLRAKTWTRLPVTLPRPLTQAATVEVQGRLYVLGGLDYDPGRKPAFQHSRAVYSWAPGDEAFKKESFELPEPRRAFAAELIGQKLILVGGMKDGFAPIDSVDIFDLEARAWSRAAAPSATRISPQAAIFQGQLIIAGGFSRPEDGDHFQPEHRIEAFDPRTGAWTTVLEQAPIGEGLRLQVFGRRLLMFSTHGQEPVLRLALLDPALDQLAARRPDSRPAASPSEEGPADEAPKDADGRNKQRFR